MTALLQKLEADAKEHMRRGLWTLPLLSSDVLALCGRERQRDTIFGELAAAASVVKSGKTFNRGYSKHEADPNGYHLRCEGIDGLEKEIPALESALAKAASFTAKDASL